MPVLKSWSIRCVALAALAVSADLAPAQFAQPPFTPNFNPRPNGVPGQPGVFVMPSVNTMPALNPGNRPFVFTPTLENPFPNPRPFYPAAPRQNPFAFNPFFNNPFAVNPLLRDPAVNNPLAVPGFNPTFGPAFAPVVPAVAFTPPVAFRQPGLFQYKRPDLQVNPWSGAVYHPISGVATLADGTTFYRIPGTGTANPNGTYANGSGLYYNPMAGTYFNPASGVVAKPGQMNVFVPYVW